MIAYSLDTGAFSRISEFSIASASNLTGGGIENNFILLLDGAGDMRTYPGSAKVNPDTVTTRVRTKPYSVRSENGNPFYFRLKRVRINFSGVDTIIRARIYNERFSAGVVEIPLYNITPNRWYGLPGSAKGHQFEIIFEKSEEIKGFQAEVIIL